MQSRKTNQRGVPEEIHYGLIRAMKQGQPRTVFDEKKLGALAESIRINGQRMPGIVRRLSAAEQKADPKLKYELIAGERRLRACTMINRAFLTFVVDDPGEVAAYLEAFLENEAREDLCVYDQAKAYAKIQRLLKCSDAEVARQTGQDQVEVNKMLRLARLPPEVFELLHPSKGKRNGLRSGVALLLTGYAKAEQLRLAPKLVGVTRKKAEWILHQEESGPVKPKASRRNPSDAAKLFDAFTERFQMDSTRMAPLAKLLAQQGNVNSPEFKARVRRMIANLNVAMVCVTAIKEDLKLIAGLPEKGGAVLPSRSVVSAPTRLGRGAAYDGRVGRGRREIEDDDSDDAGLPSELREFDESDDELNFG